MDFFKDSISVFTNSTQDTSKTESINLIVIGLENQHRQFKFNQNQLVKQVKATIANYYGIRDEGLSIIYKGRVMDDNLPIIDYQLNQYDSVNLMRRCIGGNQQ